MLAPWNKNYDQPRQHVKKQRHYFVNKGPSSQGYGFSSGHVWMWQLDHKKKLSAKELMHLNCGVGEDTWESLGLHGDPTSLSQRRLIPYIHWKDGCWSQNSNTLATWCEDLTHLNLMLGKIEGRRKRGRETGWDGWMASATLWTWIWVRSMSWWWTGRPGVL